MNGINLFSASLGRVPVMGIAALNPSYEAASFEPSMKQDLVAWVEAARLIPIRSHAVLAVVVMGIALFYPSTIW